MSTGTSCTCDLICLFDHKAFNLPNYIHFCWSTCPSTTVMIIAILRFLFDVHSDISFCAYLHDQEKIDLIFVDSDQKSGLHDITRRYNGEDVMLKIPKQYNLRDINSVELFNTETKQTYASISIGKIKNC
ncbi:Protein Skeletor,isoforms B/C [Trichinella pseudospiralis]